MKRWWATMDREQRLLLWGILALCVACAVWSHYVYEGGLVRLRQALWRGDECTHFQPGGVP